ncbi:MAG: SCO family protein [Myxococcota bacterium]
MRPEAGRTRTPGTGGRAVSALFRFLAGWGFPAFFLFTLAFATVLLAVMLVLPAEGTPLERFAEDFRIWCFGYDPATGETEWAYAATMLSSPLLLGAFVLLFWGAPLRQVVRTVPRRLWKAAVPAFALVLALSVGLGVLGGVGGAAGDDGLAFPAEALRMDRPAPAFALTDHRGEPVSLAALRGKVVVVTGIYAGCALACPMILGQAKRVVADLPTDVRSRVTVVAITFDPEHDTPEVLQRMAERYGVDAPTFRLATGDSPQVNEALDRYGFARERDPETGVIDHANLFFVVDRAGRLAYRFSLGEQQEAWLREALRDLVDESAPSA